MRLTRAGEYAVRCLLYVAGQGFGKVVSRREIASAMQIPDQFLGKIAQQLARSGFIEIVQGAKGGYRLLKSPQKMTLLDVVEAVDGEIFLNDCLMKPDSCFRNPHCTVYLVWKKAREQLRETLREASFERLLTDPCLMGPVVNDTHDKKKDHKEK